MGTEATASWWHFEYVSEPLPIMPTRPLTGALEEDGTALRYMRTCAETVEARVAEIEHDLDDRCLCRDCIEFKALQYRLRKVI
jgi:hypothetical protein